MNSNVLGCFYLRSKSLKDTTVEFTIDRVNITPARFVSVGPYLIRLEGLPNMEASSITRLQKGQSLIQHLAPNPVTDNVTIIYIVGARASSGAITLELLNTTGATVRKQVLPERLPGVYDIPLNVADLPVGVYFLRIRSDESVETRTVIVAR